MQQDLKSVDARDKHIYGWNTRSSCHKFVFMTRPGPKCRPLNIGINE